MCRGGFLAVLVLMTLAGPVAAQNRDATLADIQQQITVMSVELQSLRRELSTGKSGMTQAQVAAPLERLDGIEKELRGLTAKTEELEFRINKVVTDGTNRLGDLQFRLTELEGGDVSKLGKTETLGGGIAKPAAAVPAPEKSVELAVGEKADYQAAMALAEKGSPADALEALNAFVQNYPRSPLAAEVNLYRGKALKQLGNAPDAGRAYLESYTLAEQSDPGLASEALFQLGTTLAELKQTAEACVALGQVGAQFPGTTAAGEAKKALAKLSCS